MKSLIRFIVVFLLAGAASVPTRTLANDADHLHRTFDLVPARSSEVQYFTMESRMLSYALNGDRIGTDIFRVFLKCTPGKDGNEFTCVKFTVQLANASESEIPSLRGWSYIFRIDPSGTDEKGQVFGIDHAKFANLVDANGHTLTPDKAYHVYNAFIDFHSICDVFAEHAAGGKGIQDLTTIGQTIVHAAAYSEPTVHLGDNIEKGSTFRNGKVTMEFKGLSLVGDQECALVDYDSGESSFTMKMKPAPTMEIGVVGSSHYKGDIYKDLRTGWVKRATMSELVVSEITLPMPPNKVNTVIERTILLQNVSADELSRLSTRSN